MRLPCLLCLLVVPVGSWTVTAQDAKPKPIQAGEVVAKLQKEIAPVSTVVSNDWVLQWLTRVANLPPVESKLIFYAGKDLTIDEGTFYNSRFGSPLSYARALDLAVTAGFEGKPGDRVFDFGYGSIGHLRMLALSDIHAVGVDVAPLLKVMYSDAGGTLGSGSVRVFDGKFPKEKKLAGAIGDQFDLVLSKNVLKRGYIHPTREVVDPRMTINLGVTDEEFLASIYAMLKPGGMFVIYNFCPPKTSVDQPYVPWADGESPFTKDVFAKTGFEILKWDIVDDSEARRLGQALGWDAPGGMKLESDLFAWYTIARRPEATMDEKR